MPGGFNSTLDDYASNSTTTGALTVGSSTGGFLEGFGDRDWFAVSLLADRTYKFDITASKTPFVQIVSVSSDFTTTPLKSNSVGTALFPFYNSSLVYTPISSGKYYLDVTYPSYSDSGSFFLSAADITTTLVPVNNGQATFSITGTSAVGQTLTADVATADPDGNGTFSHTWQASANGTSWSTIATGAELTIAQAQEGQQLRLLTAYNDGQGFSESVTTAAGTVPFVNNGQASFSITGTRAVGQTLSAVLDSSDPDGDGGFSYSWQASADGNTWNLIGSAGSLTVSEAQEGQQIRLLVSYTDGQGFDESVTTNAVSVALTVAPAPSPSPTPEPAPAPAPTPEPAPAPAPSPSPTPEPEPAPAPSPAPTPEPAPAPAPSPSPTPEPEPAPAPSPAPTLEPAPAPAPSPSPTPEPDPAPTPESTVLGIQPQKTVTTIQLETPISAGTLQFTQAIVGTTKRDKITGTDQGEIIAGGGGKNRLTGGGGPDGFLFETPDGFGRKTADQITDFNSEEGDKIAISRDAFENVKRVRFKVASGKRDLQKAGRSNKNFVYDDKSGMLYFDANGKKKGWGDGGAFAKLLGVPDVERSDFVILS
jgi:hypothetical protein